MDEITKLCACERWAEAEALAREELEAIESQAKAAGLAPLEGPELESYRREVVLVRARALRRVVDVLVDAGRAGDATEHMMELRRSYRPFMSDHGCAAEYHLAVAKHAVSAGSSSAAEEALRAALEHAATSGEHRVQHAKALRLKGHLAVLRWEPDEAVGVFGEALRLLDTSDATRALLRVEYLLALAEVHYGREDPAESERCVAAALDGLANFPLVNEDEIVKHYKRRAELIRAVNAAGG